MGVTVQENVNLSITTGAVALAISVFSGVTVAESVAVDVAGNPSQEWVDVNESVNVEIETPGAAFSPNKFDNVSVAENVSVSIEDALDVDISVSDAAAVAENVVLNVNEAGAVEISIFDSVPVADVPSVTIEDALDIDVSVNETPSATDVPTVVVQDAADIDVNVNDPTGVTDVPDVRVPEINVEVNDSSGVTESVSVLVNNPADIDINVNDTQAVADIPTVSPQAAADIDISVNDSSGVTDVPTVLVSEAGLIAINVNDAVTAIDTLDSYHVLFDGTDYLLGPSFSTTAFKINLNVYLGYAPSAPSSIFSIGNATVSSPAKIQVAYNYGNNAFYIYTTDNSYGSVNDNSTTMSQNKWYSLIFEKTSTAATLEIYDENGLVDTLNVNLTGRTYTCDSFVVGAEIDYNSWEDALAHAFLPNGSAIKNVTGDVWTFGTAYSDGVGTPATDTDPIQEIANLGTAGSIFEQTTGADQPVYLSTKNIILSGPSISVNDTITVDDVPTVFISVANPDINVFDGVTVAEDVTVSIAQAADVNISVNDATGVTEDVSVEVPEINIEVFETQAVNDSPSLSLPEAGAVNINVSDNVGTAEFVYGVASGLSIEVNDASGVSENVSVTVVAAADININVNDLTTVSDVPSVAPQNAATISINVNDATTVSDVPSLSLGAASDLSINVNDSTTVTDVPTVSIAAIANLEINVSETVYVEAYDIIFDGSDWLELPTIGTGDFDITIDAYITTLADSVYFLDLSDNGTFADYCSIILDTSGGVNLHTSTLQQNGSPGDISFNVWNRFRLVKSGGQLTLYLNGELHLTQADSETWSNITEATLGADKFTPTYFLPNGSKVRRMTGPYGFGQAYINAAITIATEGDSIHLITNTGSLGGIITQTVSERKPTISFDHKISLPLADATINVNESVNISESIESVAGDDNINVSDLVSVAENISVNIESASDINISVNDSTSVAENVSVSIAAAADITVNVNDTITVSENVSVSPEAALDIDISVNDAIAVTESVNGQASAPQINVNDGVTVVDVPITIAPFIETLDLDSIIYTTIAWDSIIYDTISLDSDIQDTLTLNSRL